MKFNLVWESDCPELTWSQRAILAREIVWLESFACDASEVISHTLSLSQDDAGPSVAMYGKEGNCEDLFLAYHEKTNWIILEDIEQYKNES